MGLLQNPSAPFPTGFAKGGRENPKQPGPLCRNDTTPHISWDAPRSNPMPCLLLIRVPAVSALPALLRLSRQKFQAVLADQPLTDGGPEFSAVVLTSGSWPLNSPKTPFPLPKEVVAITLSSICPIGLHQVPQVFLLYSMRGALKPPSYNLGFMGFCLVFGLGGVMRGAEVIEWGGF